VKIISEKLSDQDLLVDCIYGGSRNGNHSDEVLPKLLGVDNGAGFRCLGSPRTNIETLKILALQTGFSDPDWPDHLDTETGLFTYYGDKRAPGDLHDTKREGNKILRNLFEFAHSLDQPTESFPLILLFGKTGTYRDTRFLGLAVPGAKGMSSDEDLTAIWRTTAEGIRFQNYRSIFTILNVPSVDRRWIKDAQQGKSLSSAYAPSAWLNWIQNRTYAPLISESDNRARSTKEQLDLSNEEREIIEAIYNQFIDEPTKFEPLAAEILRLSMPNAHDIELTRPWRDGGRDATGKYRIGTGPGAIEVDFAMEAKCYSIKNGVGVKEISRLISRLRHRQFGVLVTTSYVAQQAYKELKKDDHPVVIITAKDIAGLLIQKFHHLDKIKIWISTTF